MGTIVVPASLSSRFGRGACRHARSPARGHQTRRCPGSASLFRDPNLRTSSHVMRIVKQALRCPYTFVVMALLILLLGVASIKNTTNIFLAIDITIVTTVWQHNAILSAHPTLQQNTISNEEISSTPL